MTSPAPSASKAALPTLTSEAREFLAQPRFAVISVVASSGAPTQAVVWYKLDGDAVVFNSAVGRRWPTNLARDRRISLLVADGYVYVELRGTVEVDLDRERTQSVIAELARRYHTDPKEAAEKIAVFDRQERVTFTLRPDRIVEHLSD